MGRILPYRPQEARGTLAPWFWTPASRIVRERERAHFCCSKPPSLGSFVTAALGNECRGLRMLCDDHGGATKTSWTGKSFFFVFNVYVFIFRKRKSMGGWEERERERLICCSTYVSINTGCLLYVLWLRIEPATLAYLDDALTNWATQPGQEIILDE